MNYSVLRGKIAEAGYTQERLAHEIGIAPQSLSRKLKGKRQFTIGEAAAISACLSLDAATKAIIFLPDISQKCNNTKV